MEVRVIDRVVVQPGSLADFRHRFDTDYLPGALDRGMELVERWATPPVEVDGEPTEVTLVWRVDGPTGFFAMRGEVQRHADVAAFWTDCAPLVRERQRSIAGAW